MSFEDVKELIADITTIDIKYKTVADLMLSTSEELGELATAIKVEREVFGNKHKTLNEPAKNEAVDLIICGLSVYFALNGNMNELEDIMMKKLQKWQKNQKDSLGD